MPMTLSPCRGVLLLADGFPPRAAESKLGLGARTSALNVNHVSKGTLSLIKLELKSHLVKCLRVFFLSH